jgi:hypothetical protein
MQMAWQECAHPDISLNPAYLVTITVHKKLTELSQDYTATSSASVYSLMSYRSRDHLSFRI